MAASCLLCLLCTTLCSLNILTFLNWFITDFITILQPVRKAWGLAGEQWTSIHTERHSKREHYCFLMTQTHRYFIQVLTQGMYLLLGSLLHSVGMWYQTVWSTPCPTFIDKHSLCLAHTRCITQHETGAYTISIFEMRLRSEHPCPNWVRLSKYYVLALDSPRLCFIYYSSTRACRHQKLENWNWMVLCVALCSTSQRLSNMQVYSAFELQSDFASEDK